MNHYKLPIILPNCFWIPSSGGPLLWRLRVGRGSSSLTTSWGVPCDLSHNTLDVTYLLSRHQMMGLAWCSCLYSVAPIHYGKVTWDRLNRLTDRQTQVKRLPFRTTWRAVKILENKILKKSGNFVSLKMWEPWLDKWVNMLWLYCTFTHSSRSVLWYYWCVLLNCGI